MREIKFRAWYDGEMVNLSKLINQGYSIGFCDKDEWYVDISEDHQEQSIIMQYTGLKDKNGKEIYEGDIVFDNYYHGSKAAVEFTGLGWEPFINNLNIPYAGASPFDLENCEVIGNIYENEDLLK